MGFEEAAVLAALQVTRNQSSEAVSWARACLHALPNHALEQTELLLSGQDVEAIRAAQVEPVVDTQKYAECVVAVCVQH
jgi:hypothetical protein